jgi:hypothetical protein
MVLPLLSCSGVRLDRMDGLERASRVDLAVDRVDLAESSSSRLFASFDCLLYDSESATTDYCSTRVQ